MGLAEILGLFKELAALGASPAVQQLVLGWVAKREGVPQNVLDAALKASKEAPDPKE